MIESAIESFALEAPQPGHVPARVIDELRHGYRVASDYATAFNDAAIAQAEKYSIKPGALKRYIRAIEGDKLKDVEDEADDLQALIAAHGAPPEES